MERKPPWEEPAPGVGVLKLYETDLNPGWPKVVILNLTAERFHEFERDPLRFDRDHKLYPKQPILWISHCAQPPRAVGTGRPANPSNWIVVIIHGTRSCAVSAACPEEVVDY
jgi:hypothetical protein